MNCPVCKTKLKRSQYEGLNIHQCEDCLGHLVKFDRLKAIESRRLQTEQDLLDEMISAGQDSVHKLRCPRCMKNMEKRKKQIGAWDFFVDRCQKCRFVWLDSGELAKWQVIYEFSEQGLEAEKFRQRLNNMSPAEKAELEERISKLPEQNVALEIMQGLATEWRLGRGFNFRF